MGERSAERWPETGGGRKADLPPRGGLLEKSVLTGTRISEIPVIHGITLNNN